MCHYIYSFGLVVFTRPNLRKIGPVNIYRFLFGIEYLNLLILLAYLNNFAINIISLSSTTCQLLSVIVLVYPQIPPMLHVYISIERYVSIAYPSKRLFLRKNNNQLIYFVGLIVYNCILYSPIGSVKDLSTKKTGTSNETTVSCVFENKQLNSVINYINITNGIAIPFMLMTLMTTLLIRRIYLSRKKTLKNSRSANKQRTFKRDIRLSVSIASINLVYLCFCLPLTTFCFFIESFNLKIFFILLNINYLYYALDFFLISATNFLVRKEIWMIYKMFI